VSGIYFKRYTQCFKVSSNHSKVSSNRSKVSRVMIQKFRVNVLNPLQLILNNKVALATIKKIQNLINRITMILSIGIDIKQIEFEF